MKLDYSVDMNKIKNEEKLNIQSKAENALSKQNILNNVLMSRAPQNPNQPIENTPISNGWGRTN